MWGRKGAILCTLAWLLALALPCPVLAAPVTVTGDSDVHSVSGHMEMLRDEDGTLTIEEISSAQMNARFSPVSGIFNGGFIRHGAYWVRFTLEPSGSAGYGAWWLALVAPLVDRIDVYLPEPSGAPGFVHERGGALTALEGARARMQAYLFPLDFSGLGVRTIYVRLSGARSISLNPELWRTAPLYDHLLRQSLLYALICGFLLFTAVAGFTFGATLRDRSLILYGCYMLVTFLVFLIVDGYLALLVPRLSPDLAQRVIGVAVFSSATLGACVVVDIFSTKTRFPRLHLVYVAAIAVGLAAVLASAAGFYARIAPGLTALLVVLTLITPVAAFRFMRLNEPAGGIFFVGFSFYCIAILISQGRFLGLLPVTAFTDWGYQAVACVHSVSILLGLAVRLRTAEREKMELQTTLLARVQGEGAVLEAAVQQRTRDLEEEVASRRAAERALQTMLREQRHLLAVVSHEFRSPLGIIRASISMVRVYVKDLVPMVQVELEKMGRAVERLVGFIEACLADEQLDRASLQIRSVRTSLSDLVEQHALERGQASGRSVRHVIEPGIHAEVDPTLLGIAIDNLIDNGLKYSPDEMPVEVRLRANTAEGALSIAVEDRGVGIGEDEKGLIFDRYFRGQQTLAIPGLGLGLHVAQRIAALHGGRIDVHSTPGKGSIFMLHLPLARAERSGSAQSSGTAR